MRHETVEEEMTAHIAVVGGGYAGVAAVRSLLEGRHPSPTVTLIEPRDSHQLLPATGDRFRSTGAWESSSAVSVPFR